MTCQEGKCVATAGNVLDKYFFALIFFQVVVDAFPNQQQLRKKQGEYAVNREGNGANHKGNAENQGGFPKQDKKRIIKCKTEVSSTL